jgi:DNA-binding XRE family transcriptional regulator
MSYPHDRSRAPKRVSAATEKSELRRVRRKFGFSQAILARLLGVSLRTVSGLESGSVDSAAFRRTLTQAARLCATLSEAMHASYVGHWINDPNEMLAGLKPVEAIERGQMDLVWQIAEGLRSGLPL